MGDFVMVQKGTVDFDKIGRTLLVVFEDYEHCVGVAEEGPDEVFVDMEMLDRGTDRIVAFEIMDIDTFKPEELEQYNYKLTTDQKREVRKAYLKAINRSSP